MWNAFKLSQSTAAGGWSWWEILWNSKGTNSFGPWTWNIYEMSVALANEDVHQQEISQKQAEASSKGGVYIHIPDADLPREVHNIRLRFDRQWQSLLRHI